MPDGTTVERSLSDLVEVLREAFAEDLHAVVLFGSGAEDRLRPTSDVNLIVVLRRIDAARGARAADAVRLAHAVARVETMFLLDSEIAAAATDFAVKFADISRRRRVLLGDDPFASLSIPRAAEIRHVEQVLLNLTLRLRERALVASDERLAEILADAAGPLRAAAASIVALSGGRPVAPREALAQLAPTLGVSGAEAALTLVSAAREARPVAPDAARAAMWTTMDIARALRDRAARLAEPAA